MRVTSQGRSWFTFFQAIRPFNRTGTIRDALAGFELAAMNIPQALGYTKIAGMPVVTGFYTLLLPLLAFAVFGSSRYLVVLPTPQLPLSLPVEFLVWLHRAAQGTWRSREWWHC